MAADGFFRSQTHLLVLEYVQGFVLYDGQQQGMQVTVFFLSLIHILDMSTYRENFETWNADRNMMTQNWLEKNGDGTVSEWGQNPYWLKDRVLSGYKRYRAVASARANPVSYTHLNALSTGTQLIVLVDQEHRRHILHIIRRDVYKRQCRIRLDEP